MKKRTNPDSEANIRRIDSKPKAEKQTHGFQVHFLRGSTAVTKMFSDTIYGGKEGARRAARKFKRSAMADLPERVFAGPARGKSTGKRSKPAAKKSQSTKRTKSTRPAKKASRPAARKKSAPAPQKSRKTSRRR